MTKENWRWYAYYKVIILEWNDYQNPIHCVCIKATNVVLEIES